MPAPTGTISTTPTRFNPPPTFRLGDASSPCAVGGRFQCFNPPSTFGLRDAPNAPQSAEPSCRFNPPPTLGWGMHFGRHRRGGRLCGFNPPPTFGLGDATDAPTGYTKYPSFNPPPTLGWGTPSVSGVSTRPQFLGWEMLGRMLAHRSGPVRALGTWRFGGGGGSGVTRFFLHRYARNAGVLGGDGEVVESARGGVGVGFRRDRDGGE